MRRVLSDLQLHKPASRRLGLAGALLGISALVHMVPLLSTGNWGGAVSFRKPVTFGISVGLLLWTCGWVMDRLASRKRLEGVLSALLIWSGLIEVGLITVQAWRGVPSHFNFTTATDSIVFSAMGISIGVFSLCLLALSIWALRARIPDRPVRMAVLAGMALVLSGLGLGQWVIGLGVEMAGQLGHAPDTVLAGAAGVAKFPHAMALHGIQLLIGTSVLARLAGMSLRRQLTAVRLMTLGYGSIVAWSILHTNAGRAPIDLSGAEAVLGLSGLGLAGFSAVMIVAGFASRPAADPVRRASVTLPS